jgi:glycosyltransferase involved in cell wall biosynthesis
MRFTVLTATYNRAHTLTRAYQSLCAQTCHDFEWIIIDDGSTDRTRELVLSWKPFFPIRYTWKPNGGKHTAVNIGIAQAAGEFVVILDSDDRCVPGALERMDYSWRQIPNPEKFSNLVAHCCAEDGSMLGEPLPQPHVDVFNLGDALAIVGHADRWGMMRADILKRFPYPEFPSERFIPEGLVWNRILTQYGVRYVNEPLLIAGYAAGGLGRQGDLRYSSPNGAALYYKELACFKVPFKLRVKAAFNAVRFSLVAVARALGLFK